MGEVLKIFRLIFSAKYYFSHFDGINVINLSINEIIYAFKFPCLSNFLGLHFSLIYFAEKDAQHKWSFMDSFWWGLMVLTTVGYGARAPYTWAGQVWYGTTHFASAINRKIH